VAVPYEPSIIMGPTITPVVGTGWQGEVAMAVCVKVTVAVCVGVAVVVCVAVAVEVEEKVGVNVGMEVRVGVGVAKGGSGQVGLLNLLSQAKGPKKRRAKAAIKIVFFTSVPVFGEGVWGFIPYY
jgi:hypothetical protein